MNVKNLKPEFKIVENNNLSGLRMGHILAQFPANVGDIAHTTWGAQDVLENGIIVGLDADGTIKNYVDGKAFLVFGEELLDGNHVGLDQYGEAFEDDIVYPRAVALNAGDTFTTNNVDVGAVTATNCFAAVVAGVLTLQVAETGAQFIAKKTTLPTGVVGYKMTFLDRVLA